MKSKDALENYIQELLARVDSGNTDIIEQFLQHNATRTNLRKATLLKFSKEKENGGISETDEKIIQYFVNIQRPVKVQDLEEMEVGAFKSLENFLKSRTIRSRPYKLDLLAWLLDFEPRPFGIFQKQLKNDALSTIPAGIKEAVPQKLATYKEDKRTNEFLQIIQQLLDFSDRMKEEDLNTFFGSLINKHFSKVITHWADYNLRPILEEVLVKELDKYWDKLKKIEGQKNKLGNLLLYVSPLPNSDTLKEIVFKEFCYELEDMGMDTIDFSLAEDDDDYDGDEDDMDMEDDFD